MTTMPNVGAGFPILELIGPNGRPADAGAQPLGGIIYFMRTADCPACQHHLRRITRLGLESCTTVVVPGGATEAERVVQRHPSFSGRVYASESAHEVVGLGVKIGLQQSGTFVVADGTVVHARVATVPTGSFDADATVAALDASDQPSR